MPPKIDTDSQDVREYLESKYGAGHGSQDHMLTDEDRRAIALARRRPAPKADGETK